MGLTLQCTCVSEGFFVCNTIKFNYTFVATKQPSQGQKWGCKTDRKKDKLKLNHCSFYASCVIILTNKTLSCQEQRLHYISGWKYQSGWTSLHHLAYTSFKDLFYCKDQQFSGNRLVNDLISLFPYKPTNIHRFAACKIRQKFVCI